MKIGVIDADFIGRKRHAFPNLVCEKLSAFYKDGGAEVSLLTDYENLQDYDRVFVAKVFTDTPIPAGKLDLPNVIKGGTGFYFDKAKPLPAVVEHHMPDYNLYNGYLDRIKVQSKKRWYTDYSIGYLTRGCFRKCPFCVNQKYSRSFIASPLKEFYDESRKKLCFNDDNFFSHPKWERMLDEVAETKKPFQFRQGLDERLLTEKKCKKLFSMRYDGKITFAFDNIADYDLINEKLCLINKFTDRLCRFYVLCAFDRQSKYDMEFWKNDIISVFERIKLLGEHHCLPYIMRFEKYKDSPVYGMYVNLAAWCNQPAFFTKCTFMQLCEKRGGALNYALDFKKMFPDVADKYFNVHYWH